MIKMICSNCGSTDVLMDAFARWDFKAQAWVLDGVCDSGCHGCNTCRAICEIHEETVQ